MKYLKRFESKDKLFTDISTLEWNELTKNLVEFDDKEFDEISNYLKIYECELNKREYEIRCNIINKPKYPSEILIYKLNDEWYLVRLLDSKPTLDQRRIEIKYYYYKCDQWDGLMNLLDTKI